MLQRPAAPARPPLVSRAGQTPTRRPHFAPGVPVSRPSTQPIAKASTAAVMPIVSVSSPDRHHDASDQRLLIDPMPKKTAPVSATDSATAGPRPSTKGSSGTDPHSRNARKVLSPALIGER